MFRFTPRDTGFSLFLLDKRTALSSTVGDEPSLPIPCWRTPQPLPHAHQDHEINLVTAGTARYRYQTGPDGTSGDTREVLVSAGHILTFPAGVTHIVEVDTHVTVRGLWLHPDALRVLPPCGAGSLLSRLHGWDRPLAPRLIRDATLFVSLNELWEQAQSEYARNDGWQTEYLRGLGHLTALSLVRLLQQPRSHTESRPTSDSASERVLAVRAYLDRSYLETATLAQLADRAALSVSQFSYLFHALVGTSPKAYLTSRRMAQAQTLLATTDLPVLHIAERIGATHVATFNEQFRRHVGLTPTTYRKNAQNHRKMP